MDTAAERRKYLQIAADRPSSLVPTVLLDSANFADAILARVQEVAPDSYARAHTLIALAAVHNVLQRSTVSAPVAPIIACHIPSVTQLAVALRDDDPHVALAGAVALAAVSKVLDVSGTRYGAELALALGLLEARSLAEPLLGSSINAITTLAAAGEQCFSRAGAEVLAALRFRLTPLEGQPPPSHEMALCLLTALAGFASQPAAHGAIAAWADSNVIAAVAAHLRVLPRNLWGDRETGVSAWRRFEAAIPGSTDDLAAMAVPSLFAPRYDTRARAAYSEWVGDVAPVRERELRQRAAIVASTAAASPTDDGGSGAGAVPPEVPPSPAAAAPAGPETPPDAEPAAFLAALQSSPQLRDHTLQRRDAALLALSFLSRVPALGAPLARTDGLVVRLALIVETTVGIMDAPALAAGTLARIASAPDAAATVAAALAGGGSLLQRLLTSAAVNTAVQADVMRLAQALQQQRAEHVPTALPTAA